MELADYGLVASDLTELKRLFECATTFGSLIQVPEGLAAKLPALKRLFEAGSQDLFVSDVLKRLGPLVQQVEMLAAQYDAVVANPPYMGSGGMNSLVKKFTKDCFPNAKSDLFACFIERGFTLAKDAGHNAMVTMESWMFLSSYEKFRGTVHQQHTLRNLAHFPYDGKRPTAMGINFGVAVMSAQNTHVAAYQGHYCCSRYYELNDDGVPFDFPTPNERLKTLAAEEFKKIPGIPLAYWTSDQVRMVFEQREKLGEQTPVRQGLATADNDRFMRFWPEVALGKCGYGFASRDEAAVSEKKWFPYNKGGGFRKWFGNNEFLVNWEADGKAIRAFGTEDGGRARSCARNTEYYFLPSVTWSFISSSYFGVRYSDTGAIFDVGGSSGFPSENDHIWVTGLLCSKQVFGFMKVMNPTLNFQVGNVSALPVLKKEVVDRKPEIEKVVMALIAGARNDWNAYERSWDFQSLPILTASSELTPTLESSYTTWTTKNRASIAEMKYLEEENNHLFIDAYGLADELTPDVPIEQITLTVNPAYRYGGKLTEKEQWTRFRQDTMEELVSYAIGCMMGRYSLDAPGLIYAHSGNEKFNEIYYNRKDAKSAKKENKKTLRPLRLCGENSSENKISFPPDDDGIVPLTDTEWFDDDATNRLIEFISKAWDAAHLEDNLTFLADNLSPKKNESSRDTIRRYLCDSFFKDHLQTYKKRPIYWLLSSGKQKAFQCLVYLHRYNESTMSRVRGAYVTPLFGKFNARLEYLQNEWEAADTASAKKKIQKEIDAMKKKLAELSAFDDELRHYADKRIALDLDDGVKVNYDKFGNLLAEKKAVTGKK
ncbi:MAG: BREX-1 system adenine-specific DNA-methyltransferase PglX [Thermodesulfobacteriota bacterium]|nr:BREX-1 system adenine-specific DNA-methyltransferase PglX [Thermodesulfobacteriota bacterium]